MRVKRVIPYSSRFPDAPTMLTVYDITVEPGHRYTVAGNIVVSNSQGSKRVSLLDVNALLSHGATDTLRDASLVRGQQNDEYWLQFMSGHTPQAVHIPEVYDKFMNQLKGAGINVVRDGPRIQLMAMTDNDVKQWSGGRIIQSGETVDFDKELQPIRGGLFDPSLTGGHGGRQWSAIKLSTPLPNPVMEEPIRRILGITKNKLESVIAGKEELSNFGTGPGAITKALSDLNLDRELAKARNAIVGSRKTERDAAIRKLGYLRTAKRLGMHPKDWMISMVPVLPPVHRPVSLMGGSKIPLVSDANYLYKELLNADSVYSRLREAVGDAGAGDELLTTYNAVKAVTGLADPVHPKLVEKNVKGVLRHVIGPNPKYGVMQRKLLSSQVDNVGRATVIPNPDFDMDTIGIPEKSAYELYSKFIVRRLRRQGLSISEAVKEINNRSALAREAIEAEMQERPVISSRAPVLHRAGILAFKPTLVKGNALQVSPLVAKGYNLDHDGDAMSFHIPTSEESVNEANERLLPSRSLLSTADFKSALHSPQEEDYLAALFAMTRRRDPDETDERKVHTFATLEHARKAWLNGSVGLTDVVEILKENNEKDN